MSKWIKKGDKVIVISGNDRGKVGEVIAREEDRVVVQGVNIRQKHVKPRTKDGEGRLEKFEMPIHISNVNICGEEGKPVKLKTRIVNGTKELYYKNGQTEVVHRQI
jgi:large subunit ribosomal protein L24